MQGALCQPLHRGRTRLHRRRDHPAPDTPETDRDIADARNRTPTGPRRKHGTSRSRCEHDRRLELEALCSRGRPQSGSPRSLRLSSCISAARLRRPPRDVKPTGSWMLLALEEGITRQPKETEYALVVRLWRCKGRVCSYFPRINRSWVERCCGRRLRHRRPTRGTFPTRIRGSRGCHGARRKLAPAAAGRSRSRRCA